MSGLHDLPKCQKDLTGRRRAMFGSSFEWFQFMVKKLLYWIYDEEELEGSTWWRKTYYL